MKTNQYPRDNSVSPNDLLFGSDAQDSLKAKNFRVGDIVALAGQGSPGPQGPEGPEGPQGPSGVSTYKSYISRLTQSGTSNPVVEVIYNDLDSIPTVTRTGVGGYSVTLTGAFANSEKCVGFPTQQVLAGSVSAAIVDFSMFRQTANNFRIITRSNATTADNLLSDFPIEIRVYTTP